MAGLTGIHVAPTNPGGVGTTPKGGRLADSGLIPWKGPNDLDVMEGVFADTLTPVVVGKANMSYDIRAFVGTNRQSAAIGPSRFSNDAVVNKTTTASPGSNSRYDVIWCRQHYTAADGGSDTDTILEFGVYQGTVAASPTIPDVKATVHAGCLPLYAFLVTAGVTATSGLTGTRLHDWVPRAGGGGIYADYTPTLGGGITTKVGRVHRFEQNNKKVSGRFDVVMNAAGTTTWTMTAPATPLTSARDRVVGNFLYFSGSGRQTGLIIIVAGDTKFSFADAATGVLLTGAAADSDWFSGQFEYEAA